MSDLGEYQRKRRAGKTPEPGVGEAKPKAKRSRAKAPDLPRFVVQEHSATRLHWDLRLEHDGALASWALPNGIPRTLKDNRLAVHTEDHPLEYLDFHGDIPKGEYGAGSMTIWDRGTYEVLKWEERKVEVELHGERVQGQYALFPIRQERGKDEWMIHRMGSAADPEAEPMPEVLTPMLARLGDLPPQDDDWAFEVKWDGVRAVVFSTPGRIRFVSRTGNDITPRYPELHRMNRALSMHDAVLDGEVVAFDEQGRPDFGLLQSRIHLSGEARVRRVAKERPVTFIAFDLLWLDGHSLMGEPYEERRARLKELLAPGERWQVPDHVVGGGAALLAATREQGLEGVIAKKLGTPYEPGRRSGCWIKVKNRMRQEVVIGGWVPGEGRRRERIGALLVGVRDDGRLRAVGRVGTGFTEAELDRLRAALEPLVVDSSPFDGGGPAPPRGSVFVRPTLVCEVEFVEWTRDGVLRAPSYKGLRDDKPASLVVREEIRNGLMVEVEGRELKLSNPDKVLYPQVGFTKRDHVEYLLAIAPVLLPHIRDRQLTLKRYPNGVEGDYFYEKNAPSHRPDWVATTDDGFVRADSAATLAWLGNLADLEVHTPMHRADTPECPAMVAFDLDPGEPAGLLECCQVAVVLQGMFDHLGLKAFPKTSGSKGMQVYVPLNNPAATYAFTKGFAKAVAELLESEAPDMVVSRQAKARRKGRILVDWSQNDRHKTTVCVYSPRARPRPTVSTPLLWEEVHEALEAGDADRLVFDTAGVLRRVEEHGDLFAETLTLVQELPLGGGA
ncbi:DNA ligase D [Conexibacter sp. SYSU D00693]|uniref:DNA ligase D n=1 Tax=Conexibacter sp. SYSU D00693 TaxID=2812560 RepID=UPI00196A20F1|nr:DNA ligase D [Conexibacter sp. SYSU D00693]